MKLDFGKHKGEELDDIAKIDKRYIEWLATHNKSVCPDKIPFMVPENIEKEAERLLGEIEYPEKRFYAGIEGETIEYFIEAGEFEFFDKEIGTSSSNFIISEDLAGAFLSLENALDWLKEWLTNNGEDEPYLSEHSCIVIWEVLPSGHRKVVWGAWHSWYCYYDAYFEQGILPGYDRSLYDLSHEYEDEW